jgi:hypothetical protein
MSEELTPENRLETLENSLVRIAIETWRFKKVFDRLTWKLDGQQQTRYAGHFNWLMREVSDALELSGLSILNVEGMPFDAGMAATPINLDEFEENDILFVDSMIEPIIMNKDGILKSGTITLRKELPLDPDENNIS